MAKKTYPKRNISLSVVSYLAVFLSIAYLAFTILKPGFPSGHDIAAHIVRSKVLQEALYQGQFPVRWIEWAWAGTAHPMFNFYQGGFYYLVAFLDTIIPSHIESIKITVLLMWWLGGGFMFLFTQRFGDLPAALSAAIFVFTPYIISDVFVRAAYPELAAISFSVGVLWSLNRILISANSFFALPLSFCLALVSISHLPTLVIMVPLFAFYSLFLIITRQAKFKGFIKLFLSIILAVALAAFYLFPAILELKFVKSELLTSNYYDFHPHFVHIQQIFDTFWGYGISKEGLADGMSFQFGLLQWLIIALSVVVFFISKKSEIIFWLLMIVYALFFMHEISLSFWENVFVLGFIQYPWRFLMMVAISAACLAAILLNHLKKDLHKNCGVLLTLILIFLLYGSYLKPAVFVAREDFNIDAPDWRKRPGIIINSFVEHGYLPKDVEALPRRDIGKWEVVESPSQPLKSIEMAEVDSRVEPKVINYHYLSFQTTSDKPFILRLNIPYFPGWKIFINREEGVEQHSNNYGFMHVLVPAGVSVVEAKFTDTPIRAISNRITLVALSAIVFWQLFSLRITQTLIKGLTKK